MHCDCQYVCFIYSLDHACVIFFFFFNDTATTEIYTLSLHDALPISSFLEVSYLLIHDALPTPAQLTEFADKIRVHTLLRSEEHTSELQSRQYLVCRLLLEKKKKNTPLQAMTTILVN